MITTTQADGDIAAIWPFLSPTSVWTCMASGMPSIGAAYGTVRVRHVRQGMGRPRETGHFRPGGPGCTTGPRRDGLEALETAGWHLTEYPRMEFTGIVKRFMQTLTGEVVELSQQAEIALRMRFAVDTAKP